MRLNKLHIVFRSLSFYKSTLFYQAVIIALLTAVITGSLLTGSSVRRSLRDNSDRKLGKTGILVSSGVRYFDPSLSASLKEKTGTDCVAFLETEGFCQNFNSGKTVNDINIFGITNDFLRFHGNDTIYISTGEAAVNIKLARNLEIKEGDDIIIRFKKMDDIPANAPFAPENDPEETLVLTVTRILTEEQTGDFSLGISQIIPSNVFFNLSDTEKKNGSDLLVNRLIIERGNDSSPEKIISDLKASLKPEHIGLSIKHISPAGGYELTSKRIFIDKELTAEITRLVPSASPVITYLANTISSSKGKTPYSFVSALPQSLYMGIPDGYNMVINSWMADDLNAKAGDSLTMTWYVTNLANELEERSGKFLVSGITGEGGIWTDPTLMPQFPGIAGRESCSNWDAGIPVDLGAIRQKDEDYWNRFKGTPKAFINYETGRQLWGNNFGPATAIRFPEDVTEEIIRSRMQGSLDPLKAGFNVRDIYQETMNAAGQGVDFSSLFLSLAFFIILSSVLLLSLIISVYFDARKSQIYTLRAIGFKGSAIGDMLFMETILIAVLGSFAGVFAGTLFNFFIIKALNSVWIGAVQTDTLRASFDIRSLVTGFFISLAVIFVFLKIKTRTFLKSLDKGDRLILKREPGSKNFWYMVISFTASVILLSLSFISKDKSLLTAFAGGSILLISLVLLFRNAVLRTNENKKDNFTKLTELPLRYFSAYPSQFITQVLFIAAGLFILIATGANKKDFTNQPLLSSSGTGGYLLWCNTSIPLKDNLNSAEGRVEHDLTGKEFKDVTFVQVRKSSGDDASCLNLNYITSPPLIGLNPAPFIENGSFSFTGVIRDFDGTNAWELLDREPERNTIYGIADQTVMQWGLKLRIGDTLLFRSENGEIFNVILAAGLKPSIFQGNVIIGEENFSRFMPSVAGSSIMLLKGNPELSDTYREILSERLSAYGINIEATDERLAEFNQVTNTYLSVFVILGAFGLVLGVAGLGFILMRNYNHRKREFALMLSIGFSIRDIKVNLLTEQVLILLSGVAAGVLSALLATWPSLSAVSDLPWVYIIIMLFSVSAAGLAAIFLSMRIVDRTSLIRSLRKE
jgi:ABC-type antimicrobial peptide transport system permease subunit